MRALFFAVSMSTPLSAPVAPQVFSSADMDDQDESSDSTRRRDMRTRSNRRQWVEHPSPREVKSSAVGGHRTRSASTGAQPSHILLGRELRRSQFFGQLTGVAASPNPGKRASSEPPSVPVEAHVELEWKLMLS